MKKYIKFFILFLFFFSALGIFAAEWAFMQDYEEYEENNREIVWAVDKFISGQKISYYLEYDFTVNLQMDMKYTQIVMEAFQIWPAFARQQIIDSGRAQEFADIMPLLERGVLLQKVSTGTPFDIKILFKANSPISASCGEGAEGCFHKYYKRITNPALRANYANEHEVIGVLVHELGHFYGLGDQYREGVENASLTHSTSDRIDGTDSIMSSGYDLRCDDVDGFINLIDFALFKRQGAYSARAKQGWKSFCDNTMYKNAKVLNKKDYVLKNTTYKYDAEGNIAKIESYNPFLLPNGNFNYTSGKPFLDYENNFKVFYTLFKNASPNPVFQAVAFPLQNATGPKFSVSAERVPDEEGFFWRIPHNEDNILLNFTKDQQCKVVDKHTNDFFFTPDNRLQQKTYSYFQFGKAENPPLNTLLTRLPIDCFMTASRNAEDGFSSNCNFYLEGIDQAIVFEQNRLVSSKNEDLEKLAGQYGVSAQDIISSAQQMCLQSYPITKEDTSDYSRLCSFFSHVENTSFRY